MSSSKGGTYKGTISEVAPRKLWDGTPYIGIVVDVPDINERPERKLRYKTEKDQRVSGMILLALGGNPDQPPLPQLKALTGKAVEVQISTRTWQDREYVNLDRIRLLSTSGTFTSPADEINAALGFGDAADNGQRDDGDGRDSGGDGGGDGGDGQWDEEEAHATATDDDPEEIKALMRELGDA